jgi:hypothetical protein
LGSYRVCRRKVSKDGPGPAIDETNMIFVAISHAGLSCPRRGPGKSGAPGSCSRRLPPRRPAGHFPTKPRVRTIAASCAAREVG